MVDLPTCGRSQCRVAGQEAIENRRAGARQTQDKDGSFDLFRIDLRVVFAPLHYSEPGGQSAAHIAGRSDTTDGVQPGFAVEAFADLLQTDSELIAAEVTQASLFLSRGDQFTPTLPNTPPMALTALIPKGRYGVGALTTLAPY